MVEYQADVSDESAVASLARTASGLGRVEFLVHTAGVSPVQESVEAILRVDLLGTALMLDAFASTIANGGAGVFIAPMAATFFPQNPDLERRLATTPTAALLAPLPVLAPEAVIDPGAACGLAKRANQLRARSALVTWGQRGARVNCISPEGGSEPHGTSRHATGHRLCSRISCRPRFHLHHRHRSVGRGVVASVLSASMARQPTGPLPLVDRKRHPRPRNGQKRRGK